jgi:hypothetical protein
MPLLRYRLRDGHREYIFLELHEPLPEGHEDLSTGRGWWMERHLHWLARDEHNLRTLRELASAHGLFQQQQGLWGTENIVRHAAMLVSSGLLRVARAPLPERTVAPHFAETPEAEVPVTSEEPRWLKLHVLDDATGAPVSGLKLRFQFSDRSEKQATTTSDGLIDLQGVPPGTATVSSVLDGATLADTLALVKVESRPPPTGEESQSGDGPKAKYLARLIEHRVRDGETLESVAERYETTADAVAQFNWSTTEEAKVQRHLYLDVGCRTRKGGKFVFTSRDAPGILYVPQPMTVHRLNVDAHHTLRVKQAYEPGAFLFSA